MNTFQLKVRDFTQKTSENLYEFTSSISILYTISEYSKTPSVKKYQKFFVATQQLAIQNAILSLAKIFEINKNSVNINSINNYILTNIRQLPTLEIVDNEDYKHFQIDFEASEVIFETTFDDDGKLLSSQSKHKFDKNYSCKIIAHIIAKHKDIIEEYEDDIKALKSLRDTKIAHSDKKTISLEKTTWDKLDKLSVYVIEYLDIIEHVFLAASRSLSSDAKRNGHSLKRMLLELNDIC